MYQTLENVFGKYLPMPKILFINIEVANMSYFIPPQVRKKVLCNLFYITANTPLFPTRWLEWLSGTGLS